VELAAALCAFRGPDAAQFSRLLLAEELAPTERGSYLLVIDLSQPGTLALGRLGTPTLPAGRYVYCGSALGGLRARIARHQRVEKRRHWHVDYLLDQGRLAEVWVARSPARLECLLAKHLIGYAEGSHAVRSFGSSDCRCPGHLVRWWH
jgi:Uri superfamily endonuclease